MASINNLPNDGDILEGTIVRIEAYGAFCRLDSLGGRRPPPQGLIHISQLVPDQRVERVDDVLSVDDKVWVKVLKVEMDPASQRWKIQLSRKDVSQDGMLTDLGKEREIRERQHNELEINLTSMIGMGVALDPMADRLVMKNKTLGANTSFRGGYCLVGDDEGEPETIVEPAAPPPPKLLSMGRGRGTTLPAWMTKLSDGPTAAKDDIESDPEDDGRKKKKHDHKSRSRHGKRHRKESSKSDRKKKRRREYDDSDTSRSVDNDDRSSPDRHDRKRTSRKSSHAKPNRRQSEDDGRRLSQRRRSEECSGSIESGHERSRDRKRRRSRSRSKG